jgi:transcriptional regulator with XRE-family HTH domain
MANDQVITGSQIRAARAALRWTTEELARNAGLASRTIKRFEQEEGVPASRSSTLIEIQKAFETAGVEFIGSPEDAPGIRIRRMAPQQPE